MTTNTEGAPDPQTGRFAVWIAGGLGVAAIVAYGSYQAQQRMAARERAPEAAQARAETPSSPSQLLTQTSAAADRLDVAALADFDRGLETAAARTTQPDDIAVLRVARASALSVRALEAALRAHRTGEAAAKTELATTLTSARALTDALGRDGISPAAVGRVDARLDLAEGHDITLLHPVVLMADYPDRELRLAALSRPLFSDDAFDEGELADLTAALRAIDDRTGMERVLLALALERAGDEQGARAEAHAVLGTTPAQPLALALTEGPPAVKVAAADPVAPEALDVAPEPDTPETPEATPEPEEPEPVVAPPPEPAPTPEPAPKKAKPATQSKPASKGKPTSKGKPAAPSKPKPKRTKPTFDDLLAEGCKLVRSGEPGEGFKVLKKAHDLQPGGAKVTLCMAQAQDKLGRAASALALVDRVLRKAPKNKTALLLAARLEAGQGNKSAAENLYRRVLAIDPENAKAKKYLGQD